MAKKTISAGVVITDGDLVLLGHVTNHKHWDIPKGGADKGEQPLQAAIRECTEETGIQIPESELHMLGMYAYKPKKDLMLYLWCVTQMPDVTTLKCESKFTNSKGVKQPELDAYACVKWEQISDYCQPDLVKVLKILEKKARDTAKKHNIP
jgi:8-oxo-dGTP pyrophosphatase MutT (NUDIX family)